MVSILAVVGTGVIISYPRSIVTGSRDQMTLQEMKAIAGAFDRFYEDNSLRLNRPLTRANGQPLPTAVFQASFQPAHTPSARLEQQMNWFERYGLWFLFQSGIDKAAPGFSSFPPYGPNEAQGWRGPYIESASRDFWEVDGVDFPQPLSPNGSAYRLLYVEHDADMTDPESTVYRRLLLVTGLGSFRVSPTTDLTSFTGNLRQGDDSGFIDLRTGGVRPVEGFAVLELLNLDRRPE